MKSAVPIISIFVLLFAAFGASAQEALGRATIGIGKTRKFERGRITVKFIGVVEDSRCPIGVDCIWAGNAKIKIRVGGHGQKSAIFELNSNTGPRFLEFAGRIIKFESLLPYPKADTPTVPTNYRAAISVSLPPK